MQAPAYVSMDNAVLTGVSSILDLALYVEDTVYRKVNEASIFIILLTPKGSLLCCPHELEQRFLMHVSAMPPMIQRSET